MRRLFGLVVFLFVLYFSLQILLVYIGNGHTINYQLKDGNYSFSVHEEFRSNNKKDDNNYFINIKVNDTQFDILTYENFKRSSKIIKAIKYYEDEQYKCIYVKYRFDKVLHDVICNNGEYALAYHSIESPTDGLRNFIRDAISKGYSENSWLDDIILKEEKKSAILYTSNLINNHFIGLVANNALYRFNSIEKIGNANLPKSDVERLDIFTNEKYFILYPNEKKGDVYSFTSSETYSIGYDKMINNPKILGSYKDSVYIYDQFSQVEYEADTKAKNVLQIGDSTTLIKYYTNGEWYNKKLSEIDINNLNFGNEYESDYTNPDFIKTIKVGHKYGYYYYFKDNDGRYDIYRSDITNKDNMTYLFTTTNINNVQFVNEYVYYIENKILKYYSDSKGNRTLLEIDGMTDESLYKVFIDKTKKA